MTIPERNQQNAQHSTGPRSEEGKARSSQNALKTGLYSATACLSTEDAEAYQAHTEFYQLDLKPQGITQRDLVKSISDDVWCLDRIRALVAAQHVRVARFDGPNAEPCKMDYQHAQHRAIDILGRHEQRTKNAIDKSLKLLKLLQKQPPQKIAAPDSKPKSGFVPNTQPAAAAAGVSIPEFTAGTTPKPPASIDPHPGSDPSAPEKAAA